jgi:TonB family protein
MHQLRTERDQAIQVRKMKSCQRSSIFLTGTSLSDPNAWFISLGRQLREFFAERRNPLPRARVTALPDPGALDKLVNHPNQITSLFSLMMAAIEESIHPHHTVTTAAPVAVMPLWQKRRNRIPELLSVLTHVGVGFMLLTISFGTSSKPRIILDGSMVLDSIALTFPISPVPHVPSEPLKSTGGNGGGGGGGGTRALTPASKGVLPRASDIQLVPPAPIVLNMSPELIAEPTVIAPTLANIPRDLSGLLTIGDPLGVLGPPSAGPGTGGGIGDGAGHGVGSGTGPGVGPGSGGGYGGGPYRPGGGAREVSYAFGGSSGVSAPSCPVRPEPNYPDSARRARIQGTVVLDSIVEMDGTVDVQGVFRSPGYGLDDAAKEVLKKWKCNPGKLDGEVVPVRVQIVINFHLY